MTQISFTTRLKILLIDILVNLGALGSFLRTGARYILKRRGLLLLPIKPYQSGSTELHVELASAVQSESISPNLFKNHKTTIRTEAVFPPIMARNFKNAKINCASCAITTEGNLLIPDYYHNNLARINSSGGNSYIINNQFGVIKKTNQKEIKKGIALTGLGSFNWYHWLIEILPSAMLAKKLGNNFLDYPYLVPAEYNKYQSFRDSLEIFRLEREVIPLLTTTQYKVDDLIIIDSPAHGPFNLYKNYWPKVSDYKQNASVLSEFRQEILDALRIEKSNPKGMYFLARGNSRRNYNQEDLIGIAETLGLAIVYPEQLSFHDQVQLFHSAQMIVGASGGAWANILFCQSGSYGLTWIFPEYKEFCVYSNLAMIVGLELSYLFIEAEQSIKNSVAAYSMPYRVDPDVFRYALSAMVKQVTI